MAEDIAVSMSTPFTTDQVAPLLAATAPEPEPARRINFLIALLAYWLIPKRIGSHLAVGTWKRAWTAHVIAVVLTILLPVVIVAGIGWLSRWGLHDLRATAAQAVVAIAASSASVPTPVTVLLLFGPIPALEIALILLAVLLMPWCAGGDSAWSVFKRSLKNVYWSTTYWVVIAAVFAWLVATENRKDSWLNEAGDLLLMTAYLFIAGTPVFLWIRALLVGASRYVGPPAGPAFKPREPLCDKCGYRITGLNLASNCPECGWPVRYSLPGGQRKPTVWQQHPFRPRGLLDAARLQWTILRDRSFFERLPVHEGHAAARHFWWATLFFVLLVVLLVCWLVIPLAAAIAGIDDDRLLGTKALMAVVGLTAPILLQTLLTFAACLWAQFRLGIRDYRVSATVCYYASPLMWPAVATFITACAVLSLLLELNPHGRPYVHFLGANISINVLVGEGVMLVLVAAGLFWWLRLLRALRAVRYANV